MGNCPPCPAETQSFGQSSLCSPPRCRVTLHEPIFCACGKNSIEPPSVSAPDQSMELVLRKNCHIESLDFTCRYPTISQVTKNKQNSLWMYTTAHRRWGFPMAPTCEACGTQPPRCQEPCAQVPAPQHAEHSAVYQQLTCNRQGVVGVLGFQPGPSRRKCLQISVPFPIVDIFLVCNSSWAISCN